MKTHLMLDLETLGQKANTAVLSLGAVLFTSKEVIAETYIVPSLKSQLSGNKRAVDADTVAWWMKQDVYAKKVFEEAMQSPLTIAGFCSDFSVFIDKHAGRSDIVAWSNGAGFDVPIMEHIMHSVGLEVPWKFWNIRCYRTLKYLFPIENAVAKQSVKHNALDDARFQANCVMKFLNDNPSMDR